MFRPCPIFSSSNLFTCVWYGCPSQGWADDEEDSDEDAEDDKAFFGMDKDDDDDNDKKVTHASQRFCF